MKKFCYLYLILVITILSLVLSRPVSAQESDYGIRLRRDFGYGAGNNVRGTFTISLVGDESQVASVEFLIDDDVMAAIDQPPFRYQFHTDTYGFGGHELGARVFLQDGQVELTKTTQLIFVTPEEEQGSLIWIFGGLAGAIILGLVIFFIVQALVIKKKPSSGSQPGEGSYGVLGAAICPRCGRAFQRHVWGINLVVGKFDRCEHCGKWSLARRANPEEIRAAEAKVPDTQAAGALDAKPVRELKDALDDTQYMDEL